jgi:Serine hydrolase
VDATFLRLYDDAWRAEHEKPHIRRGTAVVKECQPMSIVCVYIDGFGSRGPLERALHPIPEWWKRCESLNVTGFVVNTRLHEHETLTGRWNRLSRLAGLVANETSFYILAYSMGCHLAIKLAVKLAAEKAQHQVKQLLLVAPDPKFLPNDLDELESPSAYKQAKKLWHTSDTPGKCFSSALKKVCEMIGPTKPHIIYSEDDLVAFWPGNTKKLKEKCPDAAWHAVTLTAGATCENVHVALKPDEIRDELSVHRQLITGLQYKPNERT